MSKKELKETVANLIDVLTECYTEPGAAGWRNLEFARRRLDSINALLYSAMKNIGKTSRICKK